MTHRPLITIALSLITIAGCGEPCGIPTTRNGIVFAAEACPSDDSSSGAAASSSGDSASETSSGEPGSTTDIPTASTTDDSGGMLPTCIAIPGPGEFWGPCLIDPKNPDAPPSCLEGFCQITGPGNLCMPACVEGDTCEAFKCLGGTCRDDGACVPACEKANDPCPVEGMFCDAEFPFPMCVYPAFAEQP